MANFRIEFLQIRLALMTPCTEVPRMEYITAFASYI